MEDYFVRKINGNYTLDKFNEVHINDFVEVVKGRTIQKGLCGKVIAVYKNDFDSDHSPTNPVAQAYFDWRDSYFYHDKCYYKYNNSRLLLLMPNGEKKFTYLNNVRKLSINMVFYEEPKHLGITLDGYIKMYCSKNQQDDYYNNLEKCSDWAKMYNK